MFSKIKFKLKNLISKILFRIDGIKESKRLGVSLGDNCRLVGIVDWGSEPYLIQIGDHVSITSSKFVTHDGGLWVFREKFPDIDIVLPIKIGSNVFIGMDCIIMPGTIIEDNVVIGAGSIVKGHIEKDSVYAGVPARKIKGLQEYFMDFEKNIIKTKQLSPKSKKEFLKNKFLV